MRLSNNVRSLNRLIAALLVLVIGVMGSVQASVHTAVMASHDIINEQTLAHSSVTAMTGEPMGHSAIDHARYQHSSLLADSDHLRADALCAELCLLISLAPAVHPVLAGPVSHPAQPAIFRSLLRQAEPETPPPRPLF